jgi:hypothetical protein
MGDKTRKKAMQIAAGGVFSALCLLLMFLTGLVPFATYSLPMLAGAMLIAVVIENGRRAALMVYVSVSVLSMFIVPDREAALMFAAFFGYYPIAKENLERLKTRVGECIAKQLLFNTAIIGSYLIAAYLLGMSELLEGMGDFGQYTAVILLVAANGVFLLYDFALTRYISVYIRWFRPRFLRR